MGKHIVGMTSEGIKKKIIIIIHESFFGYLLLKGKSLNPAYPWEVCEVKTHKQWRVLIFHNKKITNEKEVLATDCLFFFQSISPFICCWNWDTSWDDPSKPSCSPVKTEDWTEPVCRPQLLNAHSSYKRSKSLAGEAARLRGSVWAGLLATGNREFSRKLRWSTSWCFNAFCAMGTGLVLQRCKLMSHNPSAESPRGSQLSHSVTGALVLLPQSEFTHGGRVGSSLMPESDPARGRVLSLVLRTAKHTRSNSTNETSHPSVLSIHIPRSLFIQACVD